jgi:hypothetical protein
MKPSRRRAIIILTVSLGSVVLLSVVSFLCMIGWSLYASRDCDRDLKSPQAVDVSPLLSLSLPPNMNDLTEEIDLGIFHSYEIFRLDGRDVKGRYEYPRTNDNPDYSYIDVYLMLLETTDGAMRGFVPDCEGGWFNAEPSDFQYGATQNGQFCISYTVEARADPEGLCHPLGYYYSRVVIRNENLLIRIDEQTSDSVSTRKDAVIRQLAQELSN